MTGSSEGPGLHSKWKEVFDSLEAIIPIYEKGSSRISLFSDREMRGEVAAFAAAAGKPALVLDLGAGPGTLSRVILAAGGEPVLADASRKMLGETPGMERVQCVFEHLPFRPGAFDAAAAGFSLRDARDLRTAFSETRQAIRPGGSFAFCDLGKPASRLKARLIGAYIYLAPPLIGFATGGRRGLKFGSLYGTYLLVLDNRSLVRLLSGYFASVSIKERQLGGAVVVRCRA